MKLKSLQDDATLRLERMLHYHAAQGHIPKQARFDTSSSFLIPVQPYKLSELVDMEKEMW